MNQSKEHIKGWLKFFYIVFYVRAFASIMALILYTYGYASTNPKMLELFTSVDVADQIISLVLAIKIIICIKNTSGSSYNNLIILCYFMIGLGFSINSINTVIFPNVEFTYPTHIIIPLGLAIYLQQSSHAKAIFPRKNAVLEKYPTIEESKEMASGLLKMTAVSFSVILIPFVIFWLIAG